LRRLAKRITLPLKPTRGADDARDCEAGGRSASMRRTRSILLLPAIALACCALALPGTVSALARCDQTGEASFTPFHPQASDVIGFNVTLPAVYFGPPQLVLSRATIGPGSRATIELVVTTDAAPFADYQVAIATQEPVARGSGTVGRVAVGDYDMTVIVRRYDAKTAVLDEPCSRKSSRLSVYPDDGLAPVIEYYHPLLDHYFMTQDPAEIDALDAGERPGWQRTGQTLLAYRPGQTASQLPAVKRFHGLSDAGVDTHFFTIDFADQFALNYGPRSSAWTLETANAFEIGRPDQDGNCLAGQAPVYRLWNRRADSNHRYTTSRAIKAQMIAKRYVAEGYGADVVVMCAPIRPAQRSFP
jgi:uncharacterized protein DUF5648